MSGQLVLTLGWSCLTEMLGVANSFIYFLVIPIQSHRDLDVISYLKIQYGFHSCTF